MTAGGYQCDVSDPIRDAGPRLLEDCANLARSVTAMSNRPATTRRAHAAGAFEHEGSRDRSVARSRSGLRERQGAERDHEQLKHRAG